MGEQTTTFMSKRTNADRIKKDEEEIAELEKLSKGDTQEPEGEEAEDDTSTQPEAKPEELSKEEETYKKRYGDLRRHSQKVENDLKAEIDTLKTRMDNTEGLTLPTSDEDLEAWSKKYPDVAGIVQTLAAKEAEKLFGKAKIDIEDIRKGTKEAAVEKARTAITKVHTDFEELESSDEFQDWAEDQPKWVQSALFENADDPKSVIRVIDMYKMDTGQTQVHRKKAEEDAASDTRTKGRTSVDVKSEKGTIKESDVQKMSDAQYATKEEEIMEAMRSGKFIYDISGSAR